MVLRHSYAILLSQCAYYDNLMLANSYWQTQKKCKSRVYARKTPKRLNLVLMHGALFSGEEERRPWKTRLHEPKLKQMFTSQMRVPVPTRKKLARIKTSSICRHQVANKFANC